jgi:hypothetical protein
MRSKTSIEFDSSAHRSFATAIFSIAKPSSTAANPISGKLGLDAVTQRVLDQNLYVQPVSGRQERIENLLNSYICVEPLARVAFRVSDIFGNLQSLANDCLLAV